MFLHDKRRASRYVRSLFLKETMRAYAIRPYPDDRKTVTILIRSASDMFIRRAYAIRPYPGGRKTVMISIRSASDMFIRGAYAIRPYPDGRKGAVSLFAVGRGMVALVGICFMYFMVMFFVMIIG